MTEIMDCIIAIAWIWLYLVAVLTVLSSALFVVAIVKYRPLRDRVDPFEQLRQADVSKSGTSVSNGRSRLTADLL